MHIIEPARYEPRSRPRRRHPLLVILVVLLVTAGTLNYVRPLPTPVAALSVAPPSTGAAPALAWPDGGQAAIAAAGYGLLATYGNQTPLATASTTKIITALCVLQKQPIAPGQSGTTYTVSNADVDIYMTYAAEDGSLVPVTEGEQLTEYQALQALLLPSANNIADSLARWVFGGQSAYATYATQFLEQHGINQTHIGSDASGFDPGSTSTASDLAALGQLALKNPVIMQIAGQSSTPFPVAGTIQSTDAVLGQNGITGLKTGNNDQDTGAFVFTSMAHVGGKDIPLSGAVMGAPDLGTALQDSAQLVASQQQGFEATQVATSGQSMGKLQAAWGASQAIVTGQALQLVRWQGTPVNLSHVLNPTVRAGTIGTLQASAGQAKSTVALQLAHPLQGPSFWWRLTRH